MQGDIFFAEKKTSLAVVAFTKKKKERHISRKDRAVSRANTQPSSEYFNIPSPARSILCFVYMLSYVINIVLVVAAFTRKEDRKRQRQQVKQTHSFLLSIVVFACESYLFCDSCKSRFMESRNQQHHAYF